MSPEDSRHLNNLLKNFEAERLGEGDAVVGANVLAAMGVSLANIQRPGSGLTTWLGDTMAVGSSILVSGSYSTSLISEKILSGLAMRQNNLTARFGQGSRVSDPELGRFKSTHPASGDFAGNLAETIMDQLGMPGAITDQQAIECWGSILKIPVQTNLSYLRGHPMVFITGTKTAELTGQLERCHLRRPLIHIGIDGIGDFARLDSLCPAVMEGRLVVGPMAENIRGTVFATDPNSVLGEAVRSGLPSVRWADRLLWLVDRETGPVLCEEQADESRVPLGGIERRYEGAMALAWGRRISDRDSGPFMQRHEFTEGQARWMDFLKRLERDFSGIGGSARSLFVSLQFGLQQMIDSATAPSGFRFCTEQVEAFAKFLVERMVNARFSMLATAEVTRRQQLERSIMNKLSGGPHSIRELTRRFTRLTSATCEEMLLDMEARGQVFQVGGLWEIRRTGLLAAAKDRQPVLDV